MNRYNYKRILLPPNTGVEYLRATIPDYEAMLLSVMRFIADRYEKDSNYPFIDTKIDILTGQDFPADDLVRGKNTVYGWIQGRGLEALADHCSWIRQRGLDEALLSRLEAIMGEILDAQRKFRRQNKGRSSFFMTPEGEPFSFDNEWNRVPLLIEDNGPYGTSDLFLSKGMFLAAVYLGDEKAIAEARTYIKDVDAALWNGNIVRDQKQLDPKNPVEPRAGHFSHGHYMLQMNAASMLVENGDPSGIAMGFRLIGHELEFYVNHSNRLPELKDCDMWEAVGSDKLPYRENGKILSDPGHALELVGLALKFMQTANGKGLLDSAQLKECEFLQSILLKVLLRNFENGYQSSAGGICKSFDLISRQAINSDMPWWNIPETMRAALLACAIANDEKDRARCLTIFAKCHNDFARYYVRPDRSLMAVQTRNVGGEAIATIPATPDADPGYHTGLSIIDVINSIDSWTENN